MGFGYTIFFVKEGNSFDERLGKVYFIGFVNDCFGIFNIGLFFVVGRVCFIMEIEV